MSAAVPAVAVTVTTPAGPRQVPAVLRAAAELPGLPGHDEFELQPLDDTGVLFALRSAPAGGRPVRLFVVEPRTFFPDYAPALPSDALDVLGAAPDAATTLLVVVHPADDDRTAPTANLLAPIVVDPATGRLAQVVLDDEHPLRAPLG
ncbi:flagellar assembly protein FliW [Cellulomonas wangsupingiae]|uniref:Flagellar assembly protein FliW n=1 Tax=Cellulomonas wangsupingiae TaxID=2968085 RepID=A0ABY5K6Y3_9CELL|nr:flagellar assembly protein FliW [Cellulomonas wangsupingiae]MCC2334138.1 flagellar assembly protein FliW [Cellulomonas wangsupingiae]UUI65818.1 flagellar assembly protein FliW [Cellulomonas wangsupingiae]